MCVCVFLYVYVYVCVCVYACACVCMCMCMCVCVCMCAKIRTLATARWRPDAAASSSSNLSCFGANMAAHYGKSNGLAPFVNRDVADYQRLQQWSVDNPSEFWRGLCVNVCVCE